MKLIHYHEDIKSTLITVVECAENVVVDLARITLPRGSPNFGKHLVD